MTKNYALEVEDLTVAYHNTPVLWDVDVTIPQGVISAVVGPNGAGKSTLIKAALGLIKPLSGQVQMLGTTYKNVFKEIGYVPQKEAVNWDFPATVLDVVTMGTYARLGWFKRVGKQQKLAAMAALKQLKMEEFAHRHISELSGGQQQRVFIARAIVQDASIYFMDEPFVGIDIKTERLIIEILRKMRDEGKTIIVVHHALDTVKEYFDHVVLLNKEIIASGSVATTYTTQNIQKTFGGAFAKVFE